MSAQTILHPSIESMREEFEKNFQKNANSYVLKKRFELGKGYCRFNQADSSILYDILQSNDCEIIDLVNKEIEKIENEDPKNKKKKYSEELTYNRNVNLYQLWLSRGNTGSLDQFLDLILKDEELKLEKADW